MNVNQKELDNLKDLLSGQINLDSSFLTTLFNPEEPLAPNLVLNTQAASSSSGLEAFPSLPGQKLQLELDNGGGDNAVPSFFELNDVDEDGASAAPTTSNVDNSNSELNTPQVTVDDTDPLVAIMRK